MKGKFVSKYLIEWLIENILLYYIILYYIFINSIILYYIQTITVHNNQSIYHQISYSCHIHNSNNIDSNYRNHNFSKN